jgi:hypothetical protein
MSRYVPRHRRARPMSRRKVLAIVIPSALVVVLGAAGAWIGTRAFEARDLLESAVPTANVIRDAVIAGEGETARAEAEMLAIRTREAAALTSDPIWRIAEIVPFAGSNLVAVRVAAEVTDALVSDVVVPATDFSLDSVQPVDGRIDTVAVREASDFVTVASREISAGLDQLEALDRGFLVGEVSGGVERLEDAMSELDGLLSGAAPALQLLPDMLGEGGQRNYLFLFQNNAESRGTGGNPASIALITVTDGAIELTTQANSLDFRNGARPLVMPLDDETLALYGPNVGVYIQDISLTPDFPTTAQLARAYWVETYGTSIDGVVSFDPLGLQRLLGATGPVTLATGDVLEPNTAAQLLLNGVYYRYEDPERQDAFFAAAAESVFGAVTGGSANVKPLIDAIVSSVNAGNLMFWSAHPEDQEVLEPFPIAGRLPSDNVDATTFGAYFNDTTGSKMSFYVATSATLDVASCSAEGVDATMSVRLTNTVDRALLPLPGYIQGNNYGGGDIATNVMLYGPVGGTIGAVTVDGAASSAAFLGTHLGRPVVKVPILNSPGQSHDIQVQFLGGPGEYGELRIQGTPMVQPTTRTIQGATCS